MDEPSWISMLSRAVCQGSPSVTFSTYLATVSELVPKSWKKTARIWNLARKSWYQ